MHAKICCIALAFIVSVQANFSKAADVLKMGSGDWPPYTQNIPGDYGLTTELVEAVVAHMQLDLNVHWLPWKRNEVSLVKGDIFAAFPYRKTMERSEQFDFSEPIIFTTTRLFYDSNHTAPVIFEKFSDLKNVSVGGVRGYSYIEDFQSVGARLTQVNSDAQLVKMLHTRRIDFAAMDTLGGRLLIGSMLKGTDFEIATLSKPLYAKSASRLMVSRSYPDSDQLLRRFNESLAAIKANGVYQQILDKYQFVEE